MRRVKEQNKIFSATEPRVSTRVRSFELSQLSSISPAGPFTIIYFFLLRDLLGEDPVPYVIKRYCYSHCHLHNNDDG